MERPQPRPHVHPHLDLPIAREPDPDLPVDEEPRASAQPHATDVVLPVGIAGVAVEFVAQGWIIAVLAAVL